MSMQAYLDALDKAIGANDEAQAVTNFIDTGFPTVNKILSGRPDGGLPSGRLVEMYADSSVGKTALATKWMAQTQKMSGIAGFMDWEKTFDVGMAQRGMDLDVSPGKWIYKRPRTWEEGNMQATKLCQVIRENKVIAPDAPILIVFDSIAAALPQSQAEKEIDEFTMNDTTALARVTSGTLKVQAHWAAEFNATFLYLNQTRTKPGVTHGDPTTTPGGKAMEFYATCRLKLTRSKIVDKDKDFIGQQITLTAVKSKLTKPFQQATARMSFDNDGMARFDIAASLLESAIEDGLLPTSGARVNWTDGKSYFKSQLAEKINAEGTLDELKKLFA